MMTTMYAGVRDMEFGNLRFFSSSSSALSVLLLGHRDREEVRSCVNHLNWWKWITQILTDSTYAVSTYALAKYLATSNVTKMTEKIHLWTEKKWRESVVMGPILIIPYSARRPFNVVIHVWSELAVVVAPHSLTAVLKFKIDRTFAHSIISSWDRCSRLAARSERAILFILLLDSSLQMQNWIGWHSTAVHERNL